MPAITVIFNMIAGLGAAAIAFVGGYFGRKFVVSSATVSFLVGLVVLFVSCIKALFTGIVAMLALANAWFAEFFLMFVPSNLPLLLSTIFSAKICRAAFDLAKEKLHLINNAN